MPVEFEELELPFDVVTAEAPLPVDAPTTCRAEPVHPAHNPLGTFVCCPLCGGELKPEHAHFRCACGWRDSCCD